MMMIPNVNDIIRLAEQIAPADLAEKWDNSGLQIGQKNWPVKKILISLDPGTIAMEQACDQGVDMLITHHPLIFNPLKTIDFSSPVGSVIKMASDNKIAIFSAHTNLDSAKGGVNDILANKIGLTNLKALKPFHGPDKLDICKFVVYVPLEYANNLEKALCEKRVGCIGNYTCCMFANNGRGTFKPEESAKPFLGDIGTVNHVGETRIETTLKIKDLASVIEHIREYHPYETMTYDVYPLMAENRSECGIGRVGFLQKPISLSELALNLKDSFGLKTLKMAGSRDLKVEKVAICAGSGSSLMSDFFASGADAYISGDLHYHNARDVQENKRGLIDIGHFNAEHIIIDELEQKFTNLCAMKKFDVNINVCSEEKDPFIFF